MLSTLEQRNAELAVAEQALAAQVAAEEDPNRLAARARAMGMRAARDRRPSSRCRTARRSGPSPGPARRPRPARRGPQERPGDATAVRDPYHDPAPSRPAARPTPGSARGAPRDPAPSPGTRPATRCPVAPPATSARSPPHQLGRAPVRLRVAAAAPRRRACRSTWCGCSSCRRWTLRSTPPTPPTGAPSREALPAERGSITDRNGVVLAESVAARDITADPTFVKDPAATAAALAPVLGLDPSAHARADRTADERQAVRLRRPRGHPGDLGADQGPRPRRASTASRRATGPTPRRPSAPTSSASSTRPAREPAVSSSATTTCSPARTVRGPTSATCRVGRSRPPRAPRPRRSQGSDIRLTLDRDLQWYAQETLARAVKNAKAESGTVVVMTPQGEILALAAVPDLRPERPGRRRPGGRRQPGRLRRLRAGLDEQGDDGRGGHRGGRPQADLTDHGAAGPAPGRQGLPRPQPAPAPCISPSPGSWPSRATSARSRRPRRSGRRRCTTT